MHAVEHAFERPVGGADFGVGADFAFGDVQHRPDAHEIGQHARGGRDATRAHQIVEFAHGQEGHGAGAQVGEVGHDVCHGGTLFEQAVGLESHERFGVGGHAGVEEVNLQLVGIGVAQQVELFVGPAQARGEGEHQHFLVAFADEVAEEVGDLDLTGRSGFGHLARGAQHPVVKGAALDFQPVEQPAALNAELQTQDADAVRDLEFVQTAGRCGDDRS